ncbi:hypothetical protein V2J09_008739 [Rumex salicifolius]
MTDRKPLHETLPKTCCKLEMARKKQEDGTPYPPCQFMSKDDDPLFMSEDDDPFADSGSGGPLDSFRVDCSLSPQCDWVLIVSDIIRLPINILRPPLLI